MKIVILNGNPINGKMEFDSYLNQLVEAMQNNGHQVNSLQLRDLKIQYCIGCFGCWVKKPGQCIIEDDATLVRRDMINSDLVIFTSPVSMGMVSSDLKKTLDRMIGLMLPYMEFVNDELHHQRRYQKYPKLGLILAQYGDTDQEDLEIVERSFHRLAINFKSKMHFTKLTSSPITEVIDEINRL